MLQLLSTLDIMYFGCDILTCPQRFTFPVSNITLNLLSSLVSPYDVKRISTYDTTFLNHKLIFVSLQPTTLQKYRCGFWYQIWTWTVISIFAAFPAIQQEYASFNTKYRLWTILACSGVLPCDNELNEDSSCLLCSLITVHIDQAGHTVWGHRFLRVRSGHTNTRTTVITVAVWKQDKNIITMVDR